MGSSPISAPRRVGQAVKTRPFHGCNMGSIPVRVTIKNREHIVPPVFIIVLNESSPSFRVDLVMRFVSLQVEK